jgi:zinc protease
VRLATNGAVAGSLTDAVYLGFGPDYILQYPERIRAVTLEQVNAAAARFMAPEKLDLVISGTVE